MLADLGSMRPTASVIRALQFSLGIFTLTALIGIANATKVFGTLSGDTILAHVHSGTLGFITMGAFGLALWTYGGGASARAARSVLITGLATVAYVLAFWSGDLLARAIFGTIELAVIVGWWWWVFASARTIGLGRLDVPRLAVLLGFTTFVIGSTIGVAIQVLLATGRALPQPPQGPDLVGAHASAQVSGYLVLVAVAIGEWRLRADRGARSFSGLTEVYLLFVAGLAFAVGASFGIQPLLIVTNLFYVVAVIIFVVRTRSGVLGARWTAAGPARHFAIAVPLLIVNVVLLVAFVATFIQAQGDFTRVPRGLIVAYDHSMFVGVMANILFGTVLVAAGEERRWPWADAWIFALLNLGLLGFLGVLVFAGYDSVLVRETAPAMGIGALLGIVVFSMRLGATRRALARPAPTPVRP